MNFELWMVNFGMQTEMNKTEGNSLLETNANMNKGLVWTWTETNTLT